MREIATVTFFFQNMSVSPFTSLHLRNDLESERYRGTTKKILCAFHLHYLRVKGTLHSTVHGNKRWTPPQVSRYEKESIKMPKKGFI